MQSRRSRKEGAAESRKGLARLDKKVVRCRLCPRLVRWREHVEPRAAFSGQTYWRKPVPGFGDIGGRLLILGIAPAMHGGNRTGRVFTGDSSGRFLVRVLHKAGFANRPVSESTDDGLSYSDCYLTAAVKCAPPGDKPTREEFDNCSDYLEAEIALMKNLQAVLVLGSLSFRAWMDHLRRVGVPTRGMVFGHGARYRVDGGPILLASYHPSPRNTNTGKLTGEMLLQVVNEAKASLRPPKT